jgi:hypothetical protein
MPITAARRRYSPTVDRLMLTVTAICVQLDLSSTLSAVADEVIG